MTKREDQTANVPDSVTSAITDALGAVDSITPLAGGASGARLWTVEQGGAQYVVRQMSPAQKDLTKAERELACMRIAAAAGIGPRVIAGGGGIVIMEKLPGAPLSRGTPRETDPIGRLAATLRRLHAAPRFPAGPTMAQFLPHLGKFLVGLGKQPLPAFVMTVVAAADAQLDPKIVAPCHRDLNPMNILATDDAVRLIDWELAGNGDPFFDLGQVGLWVCRDDTERSELLAKYLERAPEPAEQRRMMLNRILALGFYASAFHMIAAMSDQPVPAEGPTLDEVYAAMVLTKLPDPARMSGALVRELQAEVRAQGLLS